MIRDFFLAMTSNLPFSVAFKRARCRSAGHNFDDSILIDSMRSEKHPHNTEEFVFTVNIRRCSCGCLFYDNGMSFRYGVDAFLGLAPRSKP